MAENNPPNSVTGGFGTGRNGVPQNQNIVIDQVEQNLTAQLAQKILANTNVTLKQEMVKIPDFWGEEGKDTVTVTQFISSMDKCQVSNKLNHTTTFANFRLCLPGEADKWLAYTCRLLKLTLTQKT